MATKSHWEGIEAFSGLSDYNGFCEFMKKQIDARIAEGISYDPNYGRGEVYGGRWFREIEGGEIWRLIEPDGPWGGTFERVEL